MHYDYYVSMPPRRTRLEHNLLLFYMSSVNIQLFARKAKVLIGVVISFSHFETVRNYNEKHAVDIVCLPGGFVFTL